MFLILLKTFLLKSNMYVTVPIKLFEEVLINFGAFSFDIR
jgi:hypothetical protein